MASKRKPLDDARRRVKEKLKAIDEQKEFIQNSIEQITSEVSPATHGVVMLKVCKFVRNQWQTLGGRRGAQAPPIIFTEALVLKSGSTRKFLF